MAFDDIMTLDCSQSLAPQVFRLDSDAFKRLKGSAENLGGRAITATLGLMELEDFPADGGAKLFGV